MSKYLIRASYTTEGVKGLLKTVARSASGRSRKPLNPWEPRWSRSTSRWEKRTSI